MNQQLNHDEILVIAVKAVDRIMRELFGVPADELAELYSRRGAIGHEFGPIVRDNLIDFAEQLLMQAEDQQALLRPAECSPHLIHGVDCGCDDLACTVLDGKLTAQGLIFFGVAALEDKAEIVRKELQALTFRTFEELRRVERSALTDLSMQLYADVLANRHKDLQQLTRMFELKKELKPNHDDKRSPAAEGSTG